MTSLNGKAFRFLTLFGRNFWIFWNKFRSLFYENKTLSDILFLLFYTSEQVVLFLLILIFPKYAPITAGVFAIIIISTISFEKICMESRYNKYEESLSTMKLEYVELEGFNNELKLIIKTLLSQRKNKRKK